jgi:hypothetical protein
MILWTIDYLKTLEAKTKDEKEDNNEEKKLNNSSSTTPTKNEKRKIAIINEDHQNMNKCLIKELQKWVESSDTALTDVNYEKINDDLRDFRQLDLTGVYYFVYSSDCDGTHSYEECKHIVVWLEKIMTHIPNEDGEQEEIQGILGVFQCAVNHHGHVIKC